MAGSVIVVRIIVIITIFWWSSLSSSLCHYHRYHHYGHRPLTKGQWCRVFLQVRRSLAYFWNKNTFNWNQLLPWWSTVVNATFRIPSTMGACPKMPVTMPNRGGVFGFGFGFGFELRTGFWFWFWSWAEDWAEDTVENTYESRRFLPICYLYSHWSI